MDENDISGQDRAHGRRCSRVVKPASWPRYMVEKCLNTGAIMYYWRPPGRDLAKGFTLSAESLGTNYGAACARANELNAHLDAWRTNRGAEKDLHLQPGFGTLDWLIARYYQSRAFAKVSARSQHDYRKALRLIAELTLKTGGFAGSLPVKTIGAKAADKIYDRVLIRPSGKRIRQANGAVALMARAWDVVRRLYPEVVPSSNPFRGIVKEGGSKQKPAATRDEAISLHRALIEIGHPHLAAAPLVCFELLQRPENILAGHLTWADYRPADRPNYIRIQHHKTGEMVWHRLEDEEGMLYPETGAYLAQLPRLGVPVVLFVVKKGKRKGSAVPYTLFRARALVRKARRAVGLPEHVTLDACRHGGLTELANAGATESEEMATSGHRTPDAKRRYVKRTEEQRLAAAHKRRAWFSRAPQEQKKAKSRNGAENKSRNGRPPN